MREYPLLRIGEFAQVGHVSIATLHHYDEYGLLKPAALDPHTGYRYYAFTQLSRLNRILALKDLGFTLDQIAQLLQAELSRDQMQTLLRHKQADIERDLATATLRLRQITDRLEQLTMEETMPAYDILLKHVDPLPVAAIRARLPHVSERGHLYAALTAYAARQGVPETRAELLLLHSRHEVIDGYMSIDLEVAIPLATPLPDDEPIHSRTLPGALVAYTVHTGDDLSLGRAYMALHRWIDANGYRQIAPVRQVHLQRLPQMDPRQAVTEVQFPVEKLPGAMLPQE